MSGSACRSSFTTFGVSAADVFGASFATFGASFTTFGAAFTDVFGTTFFCTGVFVCWTRSAG